MTIAVKLIEWKHGKHLYKFGISYKTDSMIDIAGNSCKWQKYFEKPCKLKKNLTSVLYYS